MQKYITIIYIVNVSTESDNIWYWYQIQISPPVKQQKSSYSVFEPTKLWDSYRELDFFPI